MRICQKHNVIFHVDASQTIYRKIDVLEDRIDLLSLSAHKMYGIKGVGLLFINNDISIKPQPLLYGGGQQKGLRPGTQSPATIASFSKATNLLMEKRDEEKIHLLNMKNLFLTKLDKEGISFELNGDKDNRHPGNLNLQFTQDISASTLITRLQPGLAISTGSSYNSGIIEESYVLRAIGLSKPQAEASIRLSFSRFNTLNNAQITAQRIAYEIKNMK